jgi:hypothetical protein
MLWVASQTYDTGRRGLMTSKEAHAEALNLRYAATLRQINHQPPAGSRKASNGALLFILTRGRR